MPRATKRPSTRQRSSTLKSYRDKRDFARTPEPPPARPLAGEGPPIFVVQKHAARQLHYDFRLELDGVLKSWSVPKGPSFDPSEKRLAVMVEDHPLDYGPFEGVIPKGEYGAGQVIVWDNGTYSPDEGGRLSFHDRAEAEERMRSELAAGKLSITLRGSKLKGSWTLVKMQRGENEWLLIKHRDGVADAERDILTEDRSAVSGLSIADLRSGRLPDRGGRSLVPLRPAEAHGAHRRRFPTSLAPMQASPVDAPFSDPAWLFEAKLDGVRTIALVRDGDVSLLARSGIDVTAQYPSIAEELAHQPTPAAAFDGEIIALDEEGRPSFETLQQRLNLTREEDIRHAETEIPVLYYVFDLLYLEGYDLSAVTLEQRKALLARVLLPSDRVLLLEHFEEEGEAAYEAARQHGLEGIVAKRRDSRYESGKRSRAWLKVKTTQSDEFVVGGYSRGQGGRAATFGALLLGRYDDEDRLIYAGHVGSGFDDRTLAGLRDRLDGMHTKGCPFTETPPLKTETTWVRPELVAEVKFAQWTQEGNLRAPVFLRLRDDKPPADVRIVDTVAPERPATLDNEVANVLEQLAGDRQKLLLNVEGHKLSLSNLNKELWPSYRRRRALTKRDLLVYLAKVSPYLLPHLRDRPLTLVRYPNGIGGGHFYQKHSANPPPEFVEKVSLFSSHNEENQQYLICNNLPTLLWLGQLADLELHTSYSRVSPEPDGHHLSTDFTGSREQIERSLLNYPDFIVFDLDPYIYSGREAKGAEPELNRKAFAKTREVAFWLKEVLDSLSLSSFVKTTGKTGLHIYVPILRRIDYAAVRAACETISRHVLQSHPRAVTMEWAVDKRPGKVFLDHNQNVRGKTLASIYSPRALPEAAVSMPLSWEELADSYPTDFTMLTAPERLAQIGDLWAGILESKHDLEGLLGTAEEK
ncbi:MAG: DNA ligase D [Chloroflexi bacterium]|nr:DNA ligase D [Chloroflexota bacterium]